MFRSTTIIRSLHLSLTKVTFIKLVKVRRYGLCGCVVACYIKTMVICVLCTGQSKTLTSKITTNYEIYFASYVFSNYKIIIIDKTPTHALFIQQYISLSC